MKCGFKVTCAALFMALMTGCQSVGSVKTVAQSCDFMPPHKQPGWVVKDMGVAGYFVGVGSADASYGEQDAVVIAKQRAEADLASGISVSVSSSVSSRLRTERVDDVEFVYEESDNVIRSITRLSLKNVQRAGRWLDRDRCQLWVRLKVDNESVSQIKARQVNEERLARAEALYGQVGEKVQGLNERFHSMKDAFAVLKGIQFKHLPLHRLDMFQPRYERRLKQLKKQLGARGDTLLVITSSEELPDGVEAVLQQRFLASLKGGWSHPGIVCRSSKSCLREARKERVKRLLLVSADTFLTSSDMGGLLGTLSLKVTSYDVASGRHLEKSKQFSDQTLAFDESSLDWSHALDRIFSKSKLAAILERS